MRYPKEQPWQCTTQESWKTDPKKKGPRYQVETGNNEKRQNRTIFKSPWLQPKQLLMIPGGW